MNDTASILDHSSFHSSCDDYEDSIFGSSSSGSDRDDASVRDEVKEVQQLAKTENARVRVWRIAVILTLLITGAVVSTLTCIFLKSEQHDDYEDAYYSFVKTIQDASEFQVTNMVQAFRSLSEKATAIAVATNSTFPFVTVPTFEVDAHHARLQSGIELFAFLPLVYPEQRKKWETYSIQNQGWMKVSRSVVLDGGDATMQTTTYVDSPISEKIFEMDTNGNHRIAPSGKEVYLPIWQVSPPPFSSNPINFNLLAEFTGFIEYSGQFEALKVIREPLLSTVQNLSALLEIAVTPQDHETFHAQFVNRGKDLTTSQNPHALLMVPVFEKLNKRDSNIVAYYMGVVPFDRYFAKLLPEGVNGIYCVLKNSCGQAYTYELAGNRGVYIGKGDKHDPAYDSLKVEIPFSDRVHPNATQRLDGHCGYSFVVYPSQKFEEEYETNLPFIFTLIVAVTFALMALMFIMYDLFVQRRNSVVVDAAARSNAIVSSLFPANIRDRLFAENEVQEGKRNTHQAPQSQLKAFLTSDETEFEDDDIMYDGKPIADLFPNTTILFADIAGFTAWSSVREPTQVFVLLETLYRAFDKIANRRRVFKVETVGDCYVAVTGLPDPRKDHAVAMCRFARDCLYKTRVLTKKLEVTLGPDTGDLSVRIGIHSGPVTAGVLRGERSRFQLFGDTMNTASRMESTGMPDRIQLSQETADLLVEAGKPAWIQPREETVIAKGKGEMKTYWLEQGDNDATSVVSMSEHSRNMTQSSEEAQWTATLEGDKKVYSLRSGKIGRLIGWNVDVLQRLLKQVVARRTVAGAETTEWAPLVEPTSGENDLTTLDEVKEIITLPKFNAKAAKVKEDPESIELGEVVMQQLHDYVCNIAAMYRENPFHNFEHASHVTMSVVKLLSRIVAPTDINDDKKNKWNMKKRASSLHDHTYGITSDPLTQFACVFSALIHDVDHTGVPNAQLVEENLKIAQVYKGKSIAEQNSVDLAWNLLMDTRYNQLRSTIYSGESERRRFRQLVVNSVMATDIVDKELKTLRNLRWEKAFSEKATAESARDVVNRKATIVIEHLIQASDVAHTMQHWHVYRKWNEALFFEMYKAYQQGRAEKDPSEFWYKGEIGFFDFYIIPLAKKLKNCGVFGVSSDEYLNYAIKNREEWEARGQALVSEMMEKIHLAKQRSCRPILIQREMTNRNSSNEKLIEAMKQSLATDSDPSLIKKKLTSRKSSNEKLIQAMKQSLATDPDRSNEC